MDPPVDPVTGDVDLPDENEFREAIARAASVAKAVGKLPGNLQRMVDEILAPQVNWRDQIRLTMTGLIGSRGESWRRPNRRRLALNPIVMLPGRNGYGCETVVVAVDTSGSVSPKELDAYMGEVGGILADVRPRRIIVIGCDARVTQVDEVRSLDEFEGVRAKGIKGGGGTRFAPVFDYVLEHDLRPEALIYCTDLQGTFPVEPAYPVVWCATTNDPVPFGDVVRLTV
jgi:predicted metal-dependent peptidase